MVGIQPDKAQQLHNLFLQLASFVGAVYAQRLGHDFFHPHPRIERGIRVLKNHLQVLPQSADLGFAESGQIFSLKPNLPFGRLQQLQNHLAGGRLAAAGFSDDSQRFSAVHGKVDAIYGPYVACLFGKHAFLEGKMLF